MKRLLLVFWLAMSALPVNSAEISRPDKIASQFFATFIKGDTAKAIDDFAALNPFLLAAQGPQLQLLKTQLEGAVKVYGPPSAVESVAVEDITPSLQRRVYLTKHAKHPLVWELYFYKAESTWLPDQIIFLDQYRILGPRK